MSETENEALATVTEKPYTPTEHERESAEAREALWQAPGKPDKLYEIASALTAAEERGRRAGIEELTDTKALLTEIRHELLREDGGHGSIAELPTSLRRASTVARLSKAIRALDAAIAPRVPHASEGPPCAGCSHPKWQHQYGSKEHAFCCEPLDELQRDYCRCKNYLAPRDSAPSSDYPGCSDPAHDCRDGTCGMGPARKDRK